MIPLESILVWNKGISPHELHPQLTGLLFNTDSNVLGSPPTENAQEMVATGGQHCLAGEPKGSSITELICFLLWLAPGKILAKRGRRIPKPSGFEHLPSAPPLPPLKQGEGINKVPDSTPTRL